jgi:hypothetical protein
LDDGQKTRDDHGKPTTSNPLRVGMTGDVQEGRQVVAQKCVGINMHQVLNAVIH